MPFNEIAQDFFNGIAIGSVIALAAVGLTLTYGILKLSNFAHGDYMTLGAYLTWFCNINGVNIWISMFLGALGTVAGMLVAEFFLWKPMRKTRATPTTLIILSIGLALFVRNGILFIWGGNNQRYDIPLVKAQDIFGVTVPFYRLVTIALAIVAAIVLHLILQNSKIGKAMRAVADNIDLARVSGINVDRIVIWTWVISGVLVAISGAMYGLITDICFGNIGGYWQSLRCDRWGFNHWSSPGIKCFIDRSGLQTRNCFIDYGYYFIGSSSRFI